MSGSISSLHDDHKEIKRNLGERKDYLSYLVQTLRYEWKDERKILPCLNAGPGMCQFR